MKITDWLKKMKKGYDWLIEENCNWLLDVMGLRAAISEELEASRWTLFYNTEQALSF